MSRTVPTVDPIMNPCKRWFQWDSTTKSFKWYDKEAVNPKDSSKIDKAESHAFFNGPIGNIHRVLGRCGFFGSSSFLTRDSRVRERRKVGTGGKARRKKQSPKR